MFNKRWLQNELNDFFSFVDDELNRIRCKQGQTNKRFEDMLNELASGDVKDLETMLLMTKATQKADEKFCNLEKKVDLLSSRFELWKEIHRENMMLLMEYLGVYLDVENDKKVIKKDKSVKTNKKK